MEWKRKGRSQSVDNEEFYSLGKSDFDDFIACWNTFGYDTIIVLRLAVDLAA
jgi:hypothetical protein